jgi:rare lipoprotein A (peptidoglycan hydrolase)
VLALVIGALALPALALASSGGGSALPGGSPIDSGSGSGTSQATGSSNAIRNTDTGTSIQNGNLTVSSTGNGITLVTRASTMLRNQLSFSGTAASSQAGQTVEIERLGHQTNWKWAPTVQATIGSDGSFSARWHTNHIGRFSIRARFVGNTSSYAASASPTVTVTVYRQSIATEYGDGFWGHKTACGQTLKRSTIGVANRTLKCGTQVALYYHGRTMIVPVIDRGPYANHADWDLTVATDNAMGIDGTATIGAVSLPQQPSGS